MWPIVRAAGQTRAGSRSSSHARIFFGPQRGCARRTAITRSQRASAVPFGCACGARDRSTSPTGPAARYRSSHLYPVLRLTPYPRHNAEKLSSPASQDKTKRIRSSIAQVSLHPIGKTLLADTETCHPCARSILLPIYPVRTSSEASPLFVVLPLPSRERVGVRGGPRADFRRASFPTLTPPWRSPPTCSARSHGL